MHYLFFIILQVAQSLMIRILSVEVAFSCLMQVSLLLQFLQDILSHMCSLFSESNPWRNHKSLDLYSRTNWALFWGTVDACSVCAFMCTLYTIA